MQQQSLFNDLHYDVSVIMVVSHDRPEIYRSIESVLNQEGLRELIIIDLQPSYDFSKKLQEFTEKNERITILEKLRSHSYAASINMAAKKAKGEYLLLLEDMLILSRDCFIRTIDQLFKLPDSFSAGVKIITPDNIEHNDSRYNKLSVKSLLNEKLGFDKFGSKIFRKKNKCKNDIEEVESLSRQFLLIRKEKFMQAGELDPKYNSSFAIIDLCNHINDMGWKNIFISKIETTSFKENLINLPGKDLRYYLKKNLSGEYFPGIIALTNLVIFTNSLLRKLRSYFKRKQKDPFAKHARFLESYKQFEPETGEEVKKGSIYDISNHSPMLIYGADTQAGLCVIRRMLAAGIEVHATYHKNIINFNHPKLHWHYANFNLEKIDFYNKKFKTMVYAGELTLLNNHLEELSKVGITRLITFNQTALLSTDGLKKTKKYEDDLAKTCQVLNIDHTIFRPTMTYGIGLNDTVSKTYRIVKKMKMFFVHKPATGFRQPIMADDLSIATILVLNNKKTYGKSYNLVGDDVITYYDISARMFLVMKKKTRVFYLPFMPEILDFLSLFTKLPSKQAAYDMNVDLLFSGEEAKKDFQFKTASYLYRCNLEDFA